MYKNQIENFEFLSKSNRRTKWIILEAWKHGTTEPHSLYNTLTYIMPSSSIVTNTNIANMVTYSRLQSFSEEEQTEAEYDKCNWRSRKLVDMPVFGVQHSAFGIRLCSLFTKRTLGKKELHQHQWRRFRAFFPNAVQP